MNCFPCFSSQRSKKIKSKRDDSFANSSDHSLPRLPETKKKKGGDETKKEKNQAENGNIAAENFTFRDLATATNNFKQECLLGEGGFGRVYKGTLKSTNQVVAVKQLDRNGLQGNKEFLVEVLMLSLLHHPNLVNLVGYCADGDQRLLVYEFMSGGSLEDHLLDVDEGHEVMDWYTRIKIASGAAKGLEYLHDKANPPVIYRDLKSSNILLDHEYNPKLSDFGLAKLGHVGDKMHVSSRVMGTYGYCAPEYAKTGQLTLKSDVYSFGVVLLELITGRRAIDTTRATNQQNLVAWALPLFRDPTKYPGMADPLLKGNFPEKDLNQAVAIAAMCLQEEASVRPLISDVVTTLSFLSSVPPPTPPPSSTSVDPLHHEEDENSGLSNGEEEEEEEEGEEGEEEEQQQQQQEQEQEEEEEKDEETGKNEEASKNKVEIRENGWSRTSSCVSSRKSENGSFSSTLVRRSSKISDKTVAWSRNSSLSSKKSVVNEEPVLSHKTSQAKSGRHGHGSSWGSENNEEPLLSHKTSKAESGRHSHGSGAEAEINNEEPMLSHKTSKAESGGHGHGSSWGSEEESSYSFSPNSESLQKSFHKKEGSQSGKIFTQDNGKAIGSENRTVSF